MPRKKARAKRQWVWAPKPERPALPNETEKASIIAACEHLIATVWKPKFLPEVKPTPFNYMIDIHGDWRAGRYRFMKRYRSGMEHNTGFEFDAPFARLDRMGPKRFDIYWMRHTGQWWHLHRDLTLDDALRTLEEDPVVQPY